MPLLHHTEPAADTKLGVWRIEEDEAFFLDRVPLQRAIRHPHKRLQHLAGRYLLQQLYPDFPLNLILIADTRKPYLPNEAYHFSISHCDAYAAVIVSRSRRVGIDAELPSPKIEAIRHKFLEEEEWSRLLASCPGTPPLQLATLAWSCKEAGFKWFGAGGVDFRQHMSIEALSATGDGRFNVGLRFKKNEDRLLGLHCSFIGGLCVSSVVT